MPTGLRVDDDDGHVSLCVAPFRSSLGEATEADRDLFDARQLFAIFVGTQEDVSVNPGLLIDTFDLTSREAEVCAYLMQGQTPTQIASASRRAEQTVRNQIQPAYAKFGVNSVQGLHEALAVFKFVGAMFNSSDKHMFDIQRATKQSANLGKLAQD